MRPQAEGRAPALYVEVDFKEVGNHTYMHQNGGPGMSDVAASLTQVTARKTAAIASHEELRTKLEEPVHIHTGE